MTDLSQNYYQLCQENLLMFDLFDVNFYMFIVS